jgi:hypothetical protein
MFECDICFAVSTLVVVCLVGMAGLAASRTVT